MPILARHSQREGYRSDMRLWQGFGLNPFISPQERRRNFSTQDFERQGFASNPAKHSSSARTRKAISSGVSRWGATSRIVSWFCRHEPPAVAFRYQGYAAQPRHDAQINAPQKLPWISRATSTSPAARTIGSGKFRVAA